MQTRHLNITDDQDHAPTAGWVAPSPNCPNSPAQLGSPASLHPVAAVVCAQQLMPVVALPEGYGLLPLTLSVGQVVSWTGLKRTKIQGLINASEIATSKVDGRTLILTSSVIELVERHRVERNG